MLSFSDICGRGRAHWCFAALPFALLCAALLLAQPGSARACSLHGALPSSTAPALEASSPTPQIRWALLAVTDAQHATTRLATGRPGGEALLRETHAGLTLLLQSPWNTALKIRLPVAARQLTLPDGSRQELRGIGDVQVALLHTHPLRVSRSDSAPPSAGTDPSAGVAPTASTGPSASTSPSVAAGAATASRTALTFSLGASLPTSPLQRRDDGSWFDADVQLGTGVVVPQAGLLLAHQRGGQHSLHLALDLLYAAESPDGIRRSALARARTGARWHTPHLLQPEVELLARAEARMRDHGTPAPDTGGWLVSTRVGLHLQPLRGPWFGAVGVELPLLNGLRGGQQERPRSDLRLGLRF